MRRGLQAHRDVQDSAQYSRPVVLDRCRWIVPLRDIGERWGTFGVVIGYCWPLMGGGGGYC